MMATVPLHPSLTLLLLFSHLDLLLRFLLLVCGDAVTWQLVEWTFGNWSQLDHSPSGLNIWKKYFLVTFLNSAWSRPRKFSFQLVLNWHNLSPYLYMNSVHSLTKR